MFSELGVFGFLEISSQGVAEAKGNWVLQATRSMQQMVIDGEHSDKMRTIKGFDEASLRFLSYRRFIAPGEEGTSHLQLFHHNHHDDNDKQ